MDSKPYLAEKTFGWDRKTVALGLNELRTGLVCFDNFKARGNKKTEVKMPQLEIDIVALAEPESQIDPKFQTAPTPPGLENKSTFHCLARPIEEQDLPLYRYD